MSAGASVADNALRPDGTKGVSDAEIIRAITDECGNLTAAAARLGISRPTIYERKEKNPEIQAALDNARESTLDDVEHVLHQKAKDGEAWAVCFFLKTQGKRRGYVESANVALTGAEGAPLFPTAITVTLVKPEADK